MNPLLRKDLLYLLRQRRLAAAHVLFVAALGALVLTSWPQQGVFSLASRAQDDLLLGLLLAQVALMALLVPGVGAVLLSGEKEAATIEMLYATRLSPGQIVFGKIASCLGFPLILLLSGLPLMALLSWRGAVNLRQMVISYLILILTGLVLAMTSLTVSVLCRRSATSLVIAYLIVLGLCGASLVPAAIMLEGQSGLIAAILHHVRGLSPVAAVLAVVHPNPGDFDGRQHELAPLWEDFISVAIFVSLICLGVIAYRLTRPPLNEISFPRAMKRPAQRTRARRILFVIDPSKVRKPIGCGNPMRAKEVRTNLLRSAHWMTRIFFAAVCLSMGLALMSLSGGTEHPDLLDYVMKIVVGFQIGLIAMVVPSITSAAVSSEFENDTFELLRLSPLSGGQIFWGKLLPSLAPALLPVVALVPAYATLFYIDPGYGPFLLRLAPIVILALALCAVLGLTCSTFASNTARAAVASYSIAAAVFVLPPLAWRVVGTHLQERLAVWLAMPSPLAMGLSTIDKQHPWRAILELWPVHLEFVGGLCVLLVLIARLRLGQLLQRG